MAAAFHELKASGQPFIVPIKYSLIRPIGHGAYGVVISAQDASNGKKVAIKKIRRAFDDKVDAKRILREIKLMKKFVHENVRRELPHTPPFRGGGGKLDGNGSSSPLLLGYRLAWDVHNSIYVVINFVAI